MCNTFHKVHIFREGLKNLTKSLFLVLLSDFKQNLEISSNFIGLLITLIFKEIYLRTYFYALFDRNDLKFECFKSILLVQVFLKKAKYGKIDCFSNEICMPLSIFEFYKCPVCNGFFHEWNKFFDQMPSLPPKNSIYRKKEEKKILVNERNWKIQQELNAMNSFC